MQNDVAQSNHEQNKMLVAKFSHKMTWPKTTGNKNKVDNG